MKHNLGDTVTLSKGTKVGMGTLKHSVDGTIARVEKSDIGTTIYAVRFTDRKGNERITWITE